MEQVDMEVDIKIEPESLLKSSSDYYKFCDEDKYQEDGDNSGGGDVFVSEIELGEFVVKTEEHYDDNGGDEDADLEPEKREGLINVDGPLIMSPAQTASVAKYSSAIGKDLKTKVTKLANGSFSCRVCGFTKTALESMRGHLSTHRPGNPFSCPAPSCTRICPTHAQLTQHIKLHLPPTTIFSCTAPNCSSTFRNRHALASHKLTHSSTKKFRCTISGCDKRFNSKGCLKTHLTVHRKPEERAQQTCPECGMTFISKAGFFHHTQRHKGIVKEKRFPCYFCPLKKESPSTRDIHLRSHTLEKPFQCKQCKMWLSTATGLQSHGRVHEKTELFQCPECERQFKWPSDLRSHVKTMHNENAEVFQCSYCPYNTPRVKDLARHEKRRHLKIHDYGCALCPKTFAEKHGLDLHMLMHGSARPFKCTICQKGFITATRLKYHMNSHSDVKKFPCPQCDNKYKTGLGRDMHLRSIHGVGEMKKDVECYFCGKGYRGWSGLLKHYRNHTAERPYKCMQPSCPRKWFKSAEMLTYHLQSRHGIGKPLPIRNDTDERFKCDQCPRDYKYKTDLSKHIKMAHDKTVPFIKCGEEGCSYQTKERKCLTQHVKTVHLKITYKCKNCKKAYKKKRDLYNHCVKCV